MTEGLARRAKAERPRMLCVMTTSGSTQRETAQIAWQRCWQLYQKPGWQLGSQLDGSSIGRLAKSPRPRCHSSKAGV